MDKEDVIYIYINTMEYNSAIKKEWNFAICNNMDGFGGYYIMFSEISQRKTNTYVIICGI